MDIGSGNGRNAIYLASLGHKVIGVDVVPEMVDVANKRAAQLDLILEFVVGDARELAFEEEMDGVVCIAALHHLPSPEDRSRAMEELWRVLKPGGIGLVSTWAREQARFATAMPVENDAPEGDVLIPWTRELDRQVFQRYYHMYARGEFEMLGGRSSWNGVVFSHAHNHHVFGRKGKGTRLDEVPRNLGGEGGVGGVGGVGTKLAVGR